MNDADSKVIENVVEEGERREAVDDVREGGSGAPCMRNAFLTLLSVAVCA